jgi:SPASM domain peptide maturase of grasp-with-spasm system
MAGKDYFMLYSSCIPVEGARRSIICDLQRSRFYFIPNALSEILTQTGNQTVSEIKSAYDNRYDDIIDEYFAFLIDNELGFWCDEPALFPGIDLTWEYPGEIANALVDIGHSSNHDFSRVFGQLAELGCKALQLRFFTEVSGNRLRAILDLLEYSPLRSVELLLTYSPEWKKDEVNRLLLYYQRISRIYLHSAPFTRKYLSEKFKKVIYYTGERLESAAQCGQIVPGYFTVTIEGFTEAQKYNTCLNKKIAIDVEGNIKNCPSMQKSFGNIRDTSLKEAAADPGFRSLWTVNKDMIGVCRDCEFRYICTDCRAFVCEDRDRYSKPLTCRYNPYRAEWEK